MKETIVRQDFYEFITLQEIKNSIKISGNFEDDLLLQLKCASILFAEDYLETEIILKQYELKGKYEGKIVLKTPVVQINSTQNIKYNLASNILYLDLKIGEECVVNYTSGMPENEIKPDIKLAIIQHISSLYDLRENAGKMPFFTNQVYEKYRKIKL